MARWLPDNPEHFVHEYENGRSMQSFADEYGISVTSVHRTLHRLSANTRTEYSTRIKPPRVYIDEDLMVSMYEAGASIKSLAEYFGVARTAITPRLIKHGVVLRSRGEQEQIKWNNMSADQRAQQYASAHASTRGREVSHETKVKHALTVQEKQLHISDTEHDFHRMLSDRGIVSAPQLAIGPYNIDLAIFPVAIEIWGGQWHWTGRHLARCEKRFRYIMNEGWHILILPIIPPQWILTDDVVDYVVSQINNLKSLPGSLREYKFIWGAGEIVTGGCSSDTILSIGSPHPLQKADSTCS